MESNNESNSSRIEEKLEDVINLSTEGPGNHNFLCIKTNQITQKMMDILRDNGYQIIIFNDVENQERRRELSSLLNRAQAYMYKWAMPQGMPQGKIAIVIKDKAWGKILNDEDLHHCYMTGTDYGIII